MSQVLQLPHLSLGLARLSEGERFTLSISPDQEAAALFASGRCAATASGRFWANVGTSLKTAPWAAFRPSSHGDWEPAESLRPRRRIAAEFRPLAHTSPWPLHQALYLPPGTGLELQALEPAEVLLIGSPLHGATAPPAPELYGPAAENSREVGQGAFRRLVTPLISPGSGSVALTLGETYNPPGGWSTYPPHRHDRRVVEDDGSGTLESQHEEVYVFRFVPAHGFGLARIYEERGAARPGADQALAFQHAEALAIMQGYHTVCAAPGYHLHYVWALAGPRRGAARPRLDAAHAWVEEQQ
jgi:5-deoxy-D-glucuronate isomerase